jgi:hypothetical protein
MTRTIPALSALAVTCSLVLFALLQRGVPTHPAASGTCLAEPAAAAPVTVAAVEVTSCGDETVLASAEAR